MIYESDIFGTEAPEPFDVPKAHFHKAFRADRYYFGAFGGNSWRVSGTLLNQDGSLHRGGHGESKPLRHDEVPEAVRKQAEVFYNDLADRLRDRYRKVALEALSEDNIVYDDDDLADDDVEPIGV